MTHRQILLLYETELRRQRKLRAERLSDLNLAFAGGTKASALLKELNT